MLALSVQLGGDSRALGVVCPSFGLFVVLGLGDWCLEGCGVVGFWPLFPPVRGPFFLQAPWREGLVAAAHRVVMDTLRVRLGFIRGLTLLSRHHSPSLSIVDEFKCG